MLQKILTITALLACIAPGAAFAQAKAPGQTQEDFKKLYEEKLKEPFFKKAAWITDYDKAREEAKKTGKPIFAYFSRSYAY